jgi:hypothetical protein
MNDQNVLRFALALGCLLALGCQDPAYVSPDTVALVVRDKATDVNRVSHCSFVPVLLGSRDEALYDVDDGLTAKFALSREQITVSFEGSGTAAWTVRTSSFDGEVTKIDDDPPSGYAVELRSPCTPDDL